MNNTNLPAVLNTFIQERQDYDLEQVIDWAEKFERQRNEIHPPFSASELVRVKGFIEYDEYGLRLHVDADGRVADNFYLINPVEPKRAKNYGGLPLESIVRILGFREQGFQLSNIQNYDAGLLDVTSLPLINPSLAEAGTTSNTQAVIYGEFVRFKKSEEDRLLSGHGFNEVTKPSGERLTGEKTHHAIVRTDDGREIEVYMPTGRIVYSGGTIENISGKLPEEGDLLRISAKISNGRFFAHWCDPCFLVDPSDARYSRAEDLRLTLDNDLDTTSGYIGQVNYPDARKLLAEVRAKEVTEAQLDRTYELTQRMPATERPVLTDKREYSGTRENNSLVDSIDSAYGVRLESMTAEEFTAFAKKALSGEIEQSGDSADTTYLFRMAPHMGFNLEQIEELAVYAIQGRINRMRGKAEQEFTDDDVLGQSINTIYRRQTPNAAMIIANTVRQLQEANIELPFDVRRCYDRLPGNQTPMIKDVNV